MVDQFDVLCRKPSHSPSAIYLHAPFVTGQPVRRRLFFRPWHISADTATYGSPLPMK
jgi:hypothetical protein